jgi:hypothetical protein
MENILLTQDKETNLRAEYPLALAVLSGVGALRTADSLPARSYYIYRRRQAFSPRRLSLSVQSRLNAVGWDSIWVCCLRQRRASDQCVGHAQPLATYRPSDPREAGRIVGEPRYGIGERLFCRRRRKNKTNRIGARHVGPRSFFQSCFEPEMSRLNAAHRGAIG